MLKGSYKVLDEEINDMSSWVIVREKASVARHQLVVSGKVDSIWGCERVYIGVDVDPRSHSA
jgi:hypothetical protein